MRRLFLSLAVLGCLPSMAWAEPAYNQIGFTVEARKEVSNDQLRASLYVEESNLRADQVAEKLNAAIKRALAESRAYPLVRVASGGIQNWPVYDKQQINGWRGRAEIRLESEAPEQAAELIGRLQKFMAVGQVGFSVSNAVRKRVENQLIPEALSLFKERARLVSRELGHSQYRIVQAQVNLQGNQGAPVMYRKQAMMAAAAESSPQFAPGESEVVVNIDGRIEVGAKE